MTIMNGQGLNISFKRKVIKITILVMLVSLTSVQVGNVAVMQVSISTPPARIQSTKRISMVNLVLLEHLTVVLFTKSQLLIQMDFGGIFGLILLLIVGFWKP